MRVLFVNHLLDPVSGGGTAERTFQLVRFQQKAGIDCEILTLDIGLTGQPLTTLKSTSIHKLKCINRRYFVPALPIFSLIRLINSFDVIHLMGHWTILNGVVALLCFARQKPYLVCPAGALHPFGRSRFLKHLYDIVIGRRLIRSANAWVAVTEAEKSDFTHYGVSAADVTVIPNGIDIQLYKPKESQAFTPDREAYTKPYVLFLGRLNLIKGPDLLLHAFIKIADKLADISLVFAGPDAGLKASLIELATDSGYGHRIHFVGHVSGVEKIALIQGAVCLAIPSRREAMSMVILEAGACRVPVVFTDQCGLEDFANAGGGVMTEASAISIAGGLEQMFSKPENLKQQASILHSIVCSNFLWESQVEKYRELYKKTLTPLQNEPAGSTE